MDQFTFAPLPEGRFRRLKPLEWPQDSLTVPEGYGRMPKVDALNRSMIRREFFCYNVKLAAISPGGATTEIIATDADGDFWLDSVCVRALDDSDQTADMPPGHFQIEDVNQGYNLMPSSGLRTGAPLWCFQWLPPANVVGTGAAGAGLRTSIIQPYCFLRAGAIRVSASIEAFAPAGAYSLYFSFSGWKEYGHAAV